MIEKIFVDTNVLIRANILTAPLHQQARGMIQQFYDDNAELWISRQVLREYIMTLTRPQVYTRPLSVSDVVTQIKSFQNIFTIADDTADVTVELLQLIQNVPVGGKQIHDANIVATMLAYNIGTLVTHNTDDFKRFASVIQLVALNDTIA